MVEIEYWAWHITGNGFLFEGNFYMAGKLCFLVVFSVKKLFFTRESNCLKRVKHVCSEILTIIGIAC